MDTQELMERIAYAIMVDAKNLKPDSKAEDFKEWDSMGTMNILIMLDSDYQLKLAPGDTSSLQSVAGITELLRKAGKIL